MVKDPNLGFGSLPKINKYVKKKKDLIEYSGSFKKYSIHGRRIVVKILL